MIISDTSYILQFIYTIWISIILTLNIDFQTNSRILYWITGISIIVITVLFILSIIL